MTYRSKHHSKSEGAKFVFDHIYKYLLPSYKVNANMYAVCGRDLEIYLDYVSKVVRAPEARAVFVENDLKRFWQLRSELANSKHHIAKKVEIVHDNIMHHDGVVATCKINQATRVEDYGLGMNIEQLLRMLIPQLNRQQALRSISNGRKLFKVQIFSASARNISAVHTVKTLNQYLDVIGTTIIRINGSGNENSELFTSGRVIKHYFNEKLPRKVHSVKKHLVQLAKNGRNAELHLYTYSSNGRMLTGMLIYK